MAPLGQGWSDCGCDVDRRRAAWLLHLVFHERPVALRAACGERKGFDRAADAPDRRRGRAELAPHPTGSPTSCDEHGDVERSTVWTLPANALVHVTIYQFDGDSGLRNPFLAQAGASSGARSARRQGDARRSTRTSLAHVRGPAARRPRAARRASPDDAKNQCEIRAVRAVEGAPHDHLHVPHRQAGPLPLAVLRAVRGRLPHGFGGPMQTIGYMDGFLNVV